MWMSSIEYDSRERRRLQNRLAQRKTRSKQSAAKVPPPKLRSDTNYQDSRTTQGQQQLEDSPELNGTQVYVTSLEEYPCFSPEEERSGDVSISGHLSPYRSFEEDEYIFLSDFDLSRQNWDTSEPVPLLPAHDTQAVQDPCLVAQLPSDFCGVTDPEQRISLNARSVGNYHTKSQYSYREPDPDLESSLAQNLSLGQRDILEPNAAKSPVPLVNVGIAYQTVEPTKSNFQHFGGISTSSPASQHLPVHGRHGSEGMTTLHLAARSGNTKLARCLLDYGADIDNTDILGCTALHYAVQNGHLDLVALLLDRGANENAVSHNGWAVVHMAGQNGRDDVIKLLIQHGVEIDIKIKQCS